MPATVTVNFMTVVHKGSNGMSTAFPDVCKTPAPPSPSPIPIPYPNIAMSSDAADTASTVKADGNPIMLQSSKYSMSSGDEAGSLFGLISNKNKGSANPKMFSMDVKADGKNVFRQLDIMTNNGGSDPSNTPPMPNLQAPKPSVPPGADPSSWELVEVMWGAGKCKCGDVVKLRTKTKNYPAGVKILHVMHRNGSKKIHSVAKGPVNGDAVEIDWIVWSGPWKKDVTKLKAKAHGGKGTKETSGELEIEKPDEFSDSVRVSRADNVVDGLSEQQVTTQTPQQVTVPRITMFGKGFGSKQVTKMVTTTQTVIAPSGKKWAWEYGYDFTIQRGKFQIHCKLKLVPQDDPTTGKKIRLKGGKLRRAKAVWRKEIESIWSRKWREHRIVCQRGDKCDCTGGCCSFPIHVKCTFVESGEHVTVNLWPGAPKGSAARHQVSGALWNSEWWNSANWFELLSGMEGNGSVVHAHEFGHNIGMGDEYTNGAVIAAYMNVAGSLMQSGTNIMKQHWDTHPAAASSGKSKPIHKRFLEAVKDNGYKLLPM